MMRLLTALLLLVLCIASAEAQTITITNPTGLSSFVGWGKSGQVMPDDNGQSYATVTFKGTYTGTAPSNVDIRFCADTSCSTVQQTYVTCTSATIGGGNWSCPMQVQNSWSGTTTPLFPQARETNATGVTSSIATNSLAAGSTPLLIGQSNMQHAWTWSAFAQDGATTSTSCTVTSVLLVSQGTIGSSVNIGWPISGTNIPNGDTIINPFNTGASTFTITPNCAAVSGTGQDILAEIPSSPIANALSVAYINGSIFSADTAASPGATYGKPEGIITLANDIGTSISGGVMASEQAQGGTSICFWVSASAGAQCTGGAGGGYSGTQANMKSINLDADVSFWVQGENDSAFSQADYFAALQNVLAWNQAIRAGEAFMVTPIKSSGVPVRQAQLQCIDTQANCFYGGGMIDLEGQSDAIHLSPASRVTLSKRQAQAYLREKGVSTSGYGPVVSSGLWDGSTHVTIIVSQEAGTALTSRNLSSSGASLSGFRVFSNGTPATISATGFTQPNQIVLTLSTKPSVPVTFDYQMGASNEATNPVYDNVPPFSDVNGLPLQPTRGTLTTNNPAATGPGRLPGFFR